VLAVELHATSVCGCNQDDDDDDDDTANKKPDALMSIGEKELPASEQQIACEGARDRTLQEIFRRSTLLLGNRNS
jgi:hypothetical protein